MDKVFVRAMLLFCLFLSGVGIFFIMTTKPASKAASVALNPLSGTTTPLENPMVLIPAGEFTMGATDGGYDELPVRQVYLDAYAIQKYEVMQHDYTEFVVETSHRTPMTRYVKEIDFFTHPNQPAIYVSWLDAYEYCAWRGFRLPTEAEWEKAARGSDGRSWPWTEPFRTSFANFQGDRDHGTVTTTVGFYEKDKSPYGLYDMAGNVREWVQDWYEEAYYKNAPLKNPKGPKQGEVKVMRGSSWRDSVYAGRTSGRLKMVPGYRYEAVGFRCAKDA